MSDEQLIAHNELIQKIEKSDRKILKAKRALQVSARGRILLQHLKGTLHLASGLDSQGQKALLALVREFTVSQRRDFLP
jgi:hypothetical protein